MLVSENNLVDEFSRLIAQTSSHDGPGIEQIVATVFGFA